MARVDGGAGGVRWGWIVLAALVVAELVARVTEPAPPPSADPYDVRIETAAGVPIFHEGGLLALRRDPLCGYVLAPDQIIAGTLPDGRRATVKVNAQGFRGDDWTLERPAGRVRVIVFGGAAAFGAGASTEAGSVAASIEKLMAPLLPEGRTLEVLNAGVPGYDSARSLSLAVNRLLDWKPDALVLLDGWADFCRGALAPSATAIADPLFLEEDELCARQKAGFRYALRGLALVRRVEGRPEGRDDRLPLLGGGEPKAAFAGRLELPDRPEAVVRYYRNLQRLGALARGAGVKLILATEPELFQRAAPLPKEEQALREALPAAYAKLARTAYPRYATAASAAAREFGAVAVDCSAALDGRPESIFMGPARVADRGNQYTAEKIVPALLRILFEEKK